MSIILGENIRELRKQAGLTQEKIALALSVTPQAVSSWERGRTEPNMGQMELLKEAFGCEMSDLLKNTYHAITPANRALIDAYESAPRNVQEAIRSLLGLGDEKKSYMQIKWYEDKRTKVGGRHQTP